MAIIHGNCLDVLREYPNSHFSSIITDPPYGLAFMGKKWDYDVPGIEIWKECLRVLKPGGTMLCFAGSRTQHRMAVKIEDSGFVIKDCLMWLYSSGFPKSLDVGKALDKLQGNERAKVCISKNGAGNKAIENLSGSLKEKDRITVSPIRQKEGKESFKEFEITKGTSDFEGYGTALKPAYEPIIIAIKPNDGSYAENALKWGVSGINIDAGRIGTSSNLVRPPFSRQDNSILGKGLGNGVQVQPQGRFPANILLDEEAAEMLGDKARFFYCAKSSRAERNAGCEGLEEKTTEGMHANASPALVGNNYIRTKMNNHHPTVKPLKLMEYLIKLIMPPKDGILLDPFAGSGSTIVASTSLGYISIGIELDKDYCDIARKRVKLEKEKTKQQELF